MEKEVIIALMELARDMGDPYAGDTEYDEEVDILVKELENIKGTELYGLLERVAEMNGQGKPQSFFLRRILIIEIICAAGVQLLK